MDQINRIHPKLRPYVEALLSHEFGLLGEHAKIINVECGTIISRNTTFKGDRFHLRISYSRKILTWQVLMSPYNLMEPPDFVMEDNFLEDADVQLIQAQVPSLAYWQPTDQKCLLNVILELLQLYKQYQANILGINPASRYSVEYAALLNVHEMLPSDIEVYVHNAARVSFLVQLRIDFSRLPMPLPKRKNILLHVDLRDNVKTVVSIIKGKELDEIFGDDDIPELRLDTYLIDYIPIVEHRLQRKVNETVCKLNQRKLLYSYLVQYFEPAILNGDNITFQNISFLLEANDTFHVINIKISINFPDEKPDLKISSAEIGDDESSEETKWDSVEYEYDSKWEINKIFMNIYNCIKSELMKYYGDKHTEHIN